MLELARRIIYAPALIGLLFAGRPDLVRADVQHWAERQTYNRSLVLLLSQPAFRSLYYHRMGQGGHLVGKVVARILAVVYRPQSTLFIHTDDIDGGLYIQHGFATIISARRIGARCWINQQVTIGYNRAGELPVLADDVKVSAGAIVIGDIHVGENVLIGAGAVVVADVAPDTVVAGVPAKWIADRPRLNRADQTTRANLFTPTMMGCANSVPTSGVGENPTATTSSDVSSQVPRVM
jgi:serine O-acetyltransferase